MENKFYVAKYGENYTYFIPNQEWSNGSLTTAVSNVGCLDKITVDSVSRLSFAFIKYKYVQKCTFIFFDSSDAVISELTVFYKSDINKNQDSKDFEINIPNAASQVAVNVYLEASYSATDIGYMKIDYLLMHSVVPHYKNLKLKTEKKDGQMFFRNSLDGKITLHGNDCDIIADSSVETAFRFYLYKNESRLYEAAFSKTDCKIDYGRYSIELNLTTSDSYNKILDTYDKTYDLFKTSVSKTKIELSKRGIIQVYILGEKTISNYCAGTVHEYEVTAPVDNLSVLQNTYYFGDPKTYKEISLNGFNYSINAACINAGGITRIEARSLSQQFSIIFKQVGEKDKRVNLRDNVDVKLLSDESKDGDYYVGGENVMKYIYDTYIIEINSRADGTGYTLYTSKNQYGNDTDFILSSGNHYPMVYVEQQAPLVIPEPEQFYLGNHVLTHNICMRILSDTKTSVDGKTNLYDLPLDDFAIGRNNYKYCIGLQFNNADGAQIVTTKFSTDTQLEPTQYGLTEYGEYFVQPQYLAGYLSSRLYPFPLAKSSWGNASLWIGFEEYVDPITNEPGGLEKLVANYSKTFYHNDAMEVGDIIKALLYQIDPAIKFESTEEFSQFLYGNVKIGTAKYNQKIVLTQKSNVLKGEYDQAAQRAEITFKQLMEIMRDCFRCYWFIDDQNRFRIEHIYYFNNGLSYDDTNRLAFELKNEFDKFNKKCVLFDQKKLSYKKSELSSRYEFMWADGTISEAMGGGFTVDVISNYTQQDKIENISTQNVSSDIDMMMYKPDEFSQDGFALMTVSKDNKVPIEKIEYYRTDNYYPVSTFVQNIYASFIYLFENYLYDMPANKLKSSIDRSDSEKYSPYNIKKSMEQEIEISLGLIPSPYTLIQTDFGVGTIESVKTDIDTFMSEISLKYEPK